MKKTMKQTAKVTTSTPSPPPPPYKVLIVCLLALLFAACDNNGGDEPEPDPATTVITATSDAATPPISDISRYAITVKQNGNVIHTEKAQTFNYNRLLKGIKDSDAITIEGKAYAERTFTRATDDDGNTIRLNDATLTGTGTKVPINQPVELLVGVDTLQLSGGDLKKQQAYTLKLRSVGGRVIMKIDFSNAKNEQHLNGLFTMHRFTKANVSTVLIQYEAAANQCVVKDDRVGCPIPGGTNSYAQGVDLEITSALGSYFVPRATSYWKSWRIEIFNTSYSVMYESEFPFPVFIEGATVDIGVKTLVNPNL